MVNENKGKVYEPKPVYNRKLLRAAIRASCIRKYGFHGVSRNMSGNFKQLRKGES